MVTYHLKHFNELRNLNLHFAHFKLGFSNLTLCLKFKTQRLTRKHLHFNGMGIIPPPSQKRKTILSVFLFVLHFLLLRTRGGGFEPRFSLWEKSGSSIETQGFYLLCPAFVLFVFYNWREVAFQILLSPYEKIPMAEKVIITYVELEVEVHVVTFRSLSYILSYYLKVRALFHWRENGEGYTSISGA
jgi:hypothetical protein